MATANFRNVSEYIASHPKDTQIVLEQVRSVIRKALPRAEEVISYRVPAYKQGDEVILYFAGWKQHYSLYPGGDRLLRALKDQLAPYEVSKGTIRFPLSERVPIKLISRIAKLRAKELAQRNGKNRKSRTAKRAVSG